MNQYFPRFLAKYFFADLQKCLKLFFILHLSDQKYSIEFHSISIILIPFFSCFIELM